MKRISVLDCTLRDGGYINDWKFGKDAIDFTIRKMCATGVEYIEIGFIKHTEFDENRTVYPTIELISEAISPKKQNVCYVGMIDMNDPFPLDGLGYRDESTIDAIRVIFKQDRVDEGYDYVKGVMDRGYLVMVQLVSTNTYSDIELIEVLEKFSELRPHAVYIVDSLGMIKRRDFLRMVYLFDNHLDANIALGYHSHNNLQQASGNAEALIEIGLSRDVIVDASAYGMGRGAGNLNMELFCDYLNEYHNKNYYIEPMLEIIDEYLNEIYNEQPWGYSLPYYLSASNGCHPNYAKYYFEKKTLTEKALNELLKTINTKDKPVYSKDRAEQYYIAYMENYVDDRASVQRLREILSDKKIILLGSGKSIQEHKETILNHTGKNAVVISMGFVSDMFPIDYVFCSNMRRYPNIQDTEIPMIFTSNIKREGDLEFNYLSYISDDPIVADNIGIMLFKILLSVGVKEVFIAGMDGYVNVPHTNFYSDAYETSIPLPNLMNDRLSKEINSLSKRIKINFLTPTRYALE